MKTMMLLAFVLGGCACDSKPAVADPVTDNGYAQPVDVCSCPCTQSPGSCMDGTCLHDGTLQRDAGRCAFPDYGCRGYPFAQTSAPLSAAGVCFGNNDQPYCLAWVPRCSDGCRDLLTDSANCGACGHQCDHGTGCFNGRCE